MKLNRKWLNEEFVDLSGVPDREFVETMTCLLYTSDAADEL